jgi:hypothetical protein
MVSPEFPRPEFPRNSRTRNSRNSPPEFPKRIIEIMGEVKKVLGKGAGK